MRLTEIETGSFVSGRFIETIYTIAPLELFIAPPTPLYYQLRRSIEADTFRTIKKVFKVDTNLDNPIFTGIVEGMFLEVADMELVREDRINDGLLLDSFHWKVLNNLEVCQFYVRKAHASEHY